MNKPRLLYYNDSRHFYMYAVEPPISLEDALRPVDEVAGTQVDTLVYGYGIGPVMPFPSQVGQAWFEGLESLPAVYIWRSRENMRHLIRQGLDPLKILVDRAHHHGLQFYGSLRMVTGGGDPSQVGLSTNDFIVAHPEFYIEDQLPPNRTGHLDFTFEPVRQERFALIEEALTRYDVDGFELDLVYDPVYFRPDRIEQGMPVMTGFIREIRNLAREVAAHRGRPVTLGARVHPTVRGNLMVGLGVPTWMADGLLDYVVPFCYTNFHMDQNMPFDGLIPLAHAGGCAVYPPLRQFYMDHGTRTTPPMYRAGAVNHLRKGSDGLYLLDLRWPLGDAERQTLTEATDPALLRRQSRHYFVSPRLEGAARLDYTSPIPADLSVVGDGPGLAFNLFVGDDLAADRDAGLLRDVRLRLRITEVSALDQIEVRLNGQVLPLDRRIYKTVTYQYAWIEYPLWDSVPAVGANTVEVAVRSRPKGLAGAMQLAQAELIVDCI